MSRPRTTHVERARIQTTKAILTRDRQALNYDPNSFAEIAVPLANYVVLVILAYTIVDLGFRLIVAVLDAASGWFRKQRAAPANPVMKPDDPTMVVRSPRVVWLWSRKRRIVPANPAMSPEGSIVVFINGKEVRLDIPHLAIPQTICSLLYARLVRLFQMPTWAKSIKRIRSPTSVPLAEPVASLPKAAEQVASMQTPVGTIISPSLRPATPKSTLAASQPHMSPQRPSACSGAVKVNVHGPAAEMNLEVMLPGSTINKVQSQASLVARVVAHELDSSKTAGSVAKPVLSCTATPSSTAPSPSPPPTLAPTTTSSSKPRLSVEAATSLPAQSEKRAELKLDGGVPASSVTVQSSTSLPLSPVVAVIPGSSSSKVQLPATAPIERPNHRLDVEPLHHEETNIKQPQPAPLKCSSANPTLSASTSAPAIGDMPLSSAKQAHVLPSVSSGGQPIPNAANLQPFMRSVPSTGTAASRGEPVLVHFPTPIPSQPANHGRPCPIPAIHPHSPGLASNAANFGVNAATAKRSNTLDVPALDISVPYPLVNGALSEGLSYVAKELEATKSRLAGVQEEHRQASAAQAAIAKDLEAKLRKAEADMKSAILLEQARATELQQKKTNQISAMARQNDELTATLKRVRAERDAANSDATVKRIRAERDAARSAQAKAVQVAAKREENASWLQKQQEAHDKAKQRLSMKREATQQARIQELELQEKASRKILADAHTFAGQQAQCQKIDREIYQREATAREDKLREQNAQLEQQLTDKVARLEEELRSTRQELEESNECEVSVLNALLQEKEERWTKHQEEREKFRNTREYFETLKQEHARLKETSSELETTLVARVEQLEAQRIAWQSQSAAHIVTEQVLTARQQEHLRKEKEYYLLIVRAEKLYKAGFEAMYRRIDKLKAERDHLIDALA